MKLEIELDLNKIDYDLINKQIIEKVAVLDIKEMYDIESKIGNKISNLVQEEVDYSYNQYLEKYWSGTTAEGRQLIQKMTKAEIESRTQKMIDDIFANDYNEDALREIVLKIIPDVFSAIMFNRLESALFKHEDSYYGMVHSMIRNEIDSVIRRY